MIYFFLDPGLYYLKEFSPSEVSKQNNSFALLIVTKLEGAVIFNSFVNNRHRQANDDDHYFLLFSGKTYHHCSVH